MFIRRPARLTINVAIIAAILVLGFAGRMVPTTAHAAAAQITLSQYVAPPGAGITVKGANFHPGDRVSVSLLYAANAPNSLRRLDEVGTTVDGNGVISTSLTVPGGTNPGFYTVVAADAHGDGASRVLQVPLSIQVKAGQAAPRIFALPGLMVSVAGTGFGNAEKITVRADFPLFTGNTLRVTKTGTTNSSGSFQSVTIQVPWQTKDGVVPLTIVGATGGKSNTVTVPMRISHRPFVVLDSRTITPSQAVVVSVAGYVPGESINVVTTVPRANAAVAKLSKVVNVNSEGMVRVGISLPRDARSGSYVITVVGLRSHIRVAATYIVSAVATTPTATTKKTAIPGPQPTATSKPSHASIVVAPRSVIPGADAQVLGTGFSANTQVTVTASIGRTSAAPQKVQVTVKTDGKGAFIAALHTPGDASAGGYTVTAQGGGKTASGTLHIAYLRTAVVSLPARAIPGTPITVTGFGYASGSKVTVLLNGQTLGTSTATASGTFKAQFTVPGSLGAGTYTLVAQDSSGRKASFSLLVYRHIATHFYFASLFTGPGFHEYLLITNSTATKAVIHITYQRQNGPPMYRTISVPAHSRATHDVNADLGGYVTAAAVVAADVPIAAERQVLHGRDGALDPGAPSPSQSWYFANGNTSHQYSEQIAVQNPTNAYAQVTLQVQPTHSKPYALHGTMHPQSRMSWNLNKTSHDAIGVIVTSDHPVVANRTISIHNGIDSKTGVKNPRTNWYFAAGPNQGGTRHWIGVINTTNQASYMVLQAYDAQGALVLTVKKWLRGYDRQGYQMNKLAGQTEVAVTVTTTRPSIAEQSTFVSGNHDADTDTFGVTNPQKSVEFAEATTWTHQDNFLALFNPNAVAIPVVVQFLNAHGGTSQATYVVAPFAHQYIDVGKVVGNSQLGLLAVSSYPFVALDRQTINDGAGAMITLGTQS